MNAQRFHNEMANGIFRPIYPVIAQNILKESQVRKGHCVDVGGGAGVLGVELARQSQLNVTVVDCDPLNIELSRLYFEKTGMEQRVSFIQACAEELPLDDNSIDLVVSLGSLFFWENRVKGMNEIWRILRPRGFAYVGGGMGSTKLKREIVNNQSTDAPWMVENKKRFRNNLPIHLELMMRQTCIPFWTLESSDEGTWIIFRK